MPRVAAWVGAGVFTAGISAAVLAGAGTANAEEDGPPKRDTTPSASRNDPAQRPHTRTARAAKQREKSEVAGSGGADKSASTRNRGKPAATRTEESEPDQLSAPRPDSVRAKARNAVQDSTRDIRTAVRDVRNATRDAVEDATRDVTTGLRRTTDNGIRPVVGQPDLRGGTALRKVLNPADRDQTDSPARLESLTSATPARPDPVDAIHDVLRSLGGLALNPEPQNYPKPLSVLGDVVFDTLATLERVVGGDPVVPPELRDSVEVSTSTLVISEGHEVESNWYFPKDGSTPERLIYLQHGFLANGPLYSYTASYLAKETNSVVVTTTFTSNPFEADGMWLGGDNLHEAVAQLFLDPDREALNTSMHNANPDAGEVPKQFVLVGHSLGGGFGPGVAGYYAEGLVRRREQELDAPNDLAGVVTYDAVPMGSIIPDAMDRLDLLEANGTPDDPTDDQPADYIPIYEIGAPLNFLNVFSDVNDQLSESRPGQFTGVVLEGGVHMDPMQGGNPLIQVVAYAIAGFPQPQNPPAVRALSVGWINDMFDENIDPATGACKDGVQCAGQYGDGDDSFTISTTEGDAVAVLIGTQRATDLTSLHAISLTDFVSAIPAGVLNGLETTCDLLTGGNCPV